MAYAGDLKSLAARIVGSSPTAPTIWLLRARVPQGCGLVSFGRRWGSRLRWNSSCLCCLPAYLGTISPQLRLILPHFSMEKRGCLAHFPREMRIWPYIILRLGERALRSAQLLHERSFMFAPPRHQPTCLVRGGFAPCDSPIHLPYPRVQQSEGEPFAARDQRGPSQLQSPMSFGKLDALVAHFKRCRTMGYRDNGLVRQSAQVLQNAPFRIGV